jgi:hypothetical protein
MTSRSRRAALEFAGVGEDRAHAYSMLDFVDLPSDMKGALLKGWHMGTVGGTTRRYRETTRRVPTNRRNGTKGPYPFAAKERHYRKLSMSELLYAQRDALQTAKIWKGQEPSVENWYMDDFHTISKEIARRRGSLKNPVPAWMRSASEFKRVVGVTSGEWGTMFRELPEWKKKEFHRRSGKKELSAAAMKWVVAQYRKAAVAIPNTGTRELPIEADRSLMARTVKYLRKRGIAARMVQGSGPGRFRVRVRAGLDEEKLLELIAKGPWALDPASELRTERQIKKWHASAKRHGGRYKLGQYEYSIKSRRRQMGLLNPKRAYRKYYVVRASHPLGGLYWVAVTSFAHIPSKIVGKVFVVSASNKRDAILEVKDPESRWMKK